MGANHSADECLRTPTRALKEREVINIEGSECNILVVEVRITYHSAYAEILLGLFSDAQ